MATKRNTKQRELILSIINTSTEHLNAKEIHVRACQTLPKISLGTVYRDLNNMVDEGIILRIKSLDGDHFDNTIREHNHFICINCNKIYDVFNDIVEVSFGQVLSCDYKGICNDCLGKEKYGIKRN